MRVCLMVEGQEGVSWEQWLALAGAAEAAGLEGLFRSDHYLPIVRRGERRALDAWAILAALAARTERLQLGTLVSPVTFRHPAVLARNAVTVHEISGGRCELGIGAGWYEAEHEAYGFAFPPLRERMDELDRQLAHVAGAFAELEPRPRIVVGGRATRRSVQSAVRFADEYNTFSATVEQVRERRRAVDDGARAAGREPLAFSLMTTAVLGADDAEAQERWTSYGNTSAEPGPEIVFGGVERAAEQLRAFEAAGVERVMLRQPAHEDLESVALLGELARAFA